MDSGEDDYKDNYKDDVPSGWLSTSIRVDHPSGMTLSRIDKSLVVTATCKGAGANRAGLAAGDIITEIDGRVTFSHSVAIHLIEQLGSAAGSVVLKVQKGPAGKGARH